MDKPAKRAKTLDTLNGVDDPPDANESGNNGSARKRGSTGGGNGSASKAKKAVVVENPGVVQARRDQNRIAQREFRMRKQQHIRDLEARVAILSGDRDERQEVMSLLIRNLMNENAQLRKMVKNLAGFIGEGLATCLPRLGLTQESMDAFVNRAETEAAHEAYEALMAVKKKEELKNAASAASASGGNNKKGSSYEQLFGPIGGNDTPPESLAGSFKRKASDLADEDDDDGYEDGEGDDDLGEGDSEHNNSGPRASSASRPEGNVRGASTSNVMSRSPSLNFGTNGATHNNRRGLTSGPSSVRTAPVSTTHGVPLHTLDRLDSPSIGDTGPVDFSFSPYYNQPSSSAGGEGITPGGLSQAMGANTDGIPLQYLSSTLHELRDPLASPETSMTGNQLPQYVYQPQPQHQQQQQPQQRAMTLGGLPQQTQYVPPPMAALTTSNGPSAIRPEQGEAARETFDREFDRVISTSMGRKQESFQLISYHLNNFHVNPNYVLPLSLRPTHAQRTMPHEHIIDGIIFPTLRDKMIMLRGKYNIFDALRGMWDAFQIMGEDTLDHNSWEVSEQWMKQNLMLVDNEVIAISNRWRLKRGEPAITRESLLATTT